MKNRPGFTLPDLLITMVVLGLITASLSQVMLTQSRFIQTQEGRSEARAVSRSAMNLLMSEMRMVETSGGVVAASPTAITLRVPYQMGVICQDDGLNMWVAMAPVDSMVIEGAKPGLSGFAWRAANGTYTYVESGVAVGSGSGSESKCTSATPPISLMTDGSFIKVQPSVGAPPGSAILLYQRIRYQFAASVTLPGHLALWRIVVPTAQAEELVAPFDSTAAFRFYVEGSPTPQSLIPIPLSDMRGLELRLTALNRRAGNRNPEERAPFLTAVFFKNRT